MLRTSELRHVHIVTGGQGPKLLVHRMETY